VCRAGGHCDPPPFPTPRSSDLRVARIRAEVFGSLALTGRGHGTDKALLMGLEGHLPNLIDPDMIPAALARIRGERRISLGGRHRSEEHTSELQSRENLVCRLLL